MVKKISKKDKAYYICEACDYVYANKEWAKKCEVWCKKHKSCNMRITKFAVKRG